MFLGYHENPEATDQALKDGWFYTGDLFRRDARGFHFIVGRKKDMIRRSGENIACREVEGVLRDMDEIEEVALIPVPDDIRGEEVKAYLTLQNGYAPDTALIDQIVAYADVYGGAKPNVGLVGQGEIALYLPRGSRQCLSATVNYQAPLLPPVRQGDRIAELRVFCNDQLVQAAPLYAAEDIGQGDLIRRATDALKQLALGWL